MEENSNKRRGTFDTVSDAASRIILFVSRPGIPNVIAGLGPIVLSVFGVIFFLALVIVITGGGVGPGVDIDQPKTPTPAPIAGIPPTVGADLLQCSFKNQTRTVKIVNPSLAALVTNVADKTGVPNSLIAAVLTRENEAIITNTHDKCIFDSDYCAVLGGYDSELEQYATGAMQIMPSTFEAAAKKYQGELAEKFGKTDYSKDTQQHVLVDNDPVLRIASIRDSIIAGAYELRRIKENDRNLRDSVWNETVVKEVAARYHGGEGRPSCADNYCGDVWEGVQRCEFNPIASVLKIHDSVNSVCPTGVWGGRNGIDNVESCIADIPQSLPNIETVKNIIRSSARRAHPGELVLQCVGFVEAAVEAANSPSLLKKAAALLYAQSPFPNGYSFSQRGESPIRLGDIPIWNNPPSGHIAFVVAVDDQENVTIVEANYCIDVTTYPCGRIGKRNIKLSTSKPLGWLRRTQ